MILSRQSVELLAPAGSPNVLAAAVAAGADAVYLGGKQFNMRMHRADMNFDDQALADAIAYTRERGVRLYVTINNLISDAELPKLREYLSWLEEHRPDALIVQDPATLQLARQMKLAIPLHASVMMNTHSEAAVRKLQKYGVARVVANREMTLAQLALLKERTGVEVEYFIHGDMCISQSGQCLHSGVLFGQSSNRGRCLKPCRWPYRLVDEDGGEVCAAGDPGPYKLAVKDICMYRVLPELIQSGVCSFKIEGRMRTADFVSRIVKTYRKAIDRYLADPTGYHTDEADWNDLWENRSRDFSTCYALGNPGAASIGYSGEHEPRFFSQAVKESGMITPPFLSAPPAEAAPSARPRLAVHVKNLEALQKACENGADTLYIGGEAYRPDHPWTLEAIKTAVGTAAGYGAKVVVATPRIAMERECGELEQLFHRLQDIRPAGVMVGNPGVLYLAQKYAGLPLWADYSFNALNHLAAQWLRENGAVQATVSLEAGYDQVLDLLRRSPLPLEMIVHGPLEGMISDHPLAEAVLGQDDAGRRLALLDSAGEPHPIRVDQYRRSHILLARDLCLLPHLPHLAGAASFRIEARLYDAELTGLLTRAYRLQLDGWADAGRRFDPGLLDEITASSPRRLSLGAFRYRASR